MKRIVAISGSLRKDSYNTRFLQEIEKILENKLSFEIIDISLFPLFNEDLEDTVPSEVTKNKDIIANSDLVLISTPEYNYSVSGVLKNALDWFSRGDIKVFDNKSVAIMSASLSRFGGVRAQSHLRQILLCMGANVANGPELHLSSVYEVFDKDQLIDENTKNALLEFADSLINN